MKYRILTFTIIFTLLFSLTAYGDIPKFHYDFDEALKMAMDNTPEYKKMDKIIDDAYDTYETLDKIPLPDIKYTGNMKSFIERQVNPHINLEKAFYGYQKVIVMRNNIKRQVELGLREIVIGIEKAEMTAKEAEINKNNIKDKERLLGIQYEEGLLSKNAYRNAKDEIKNNLKKFDEIDKAIDEVYHQLNILLGRGDEKDIVIHLNDTRVPIENLDLKQIKRDMINNGKSANTYDVIPSMGSESLKELKDERSIESYRHSLIKERYDRYDLDKFTDKMRDDIEEMYEEAKNDYEIANNKYENALARFEKSFDDMIENIEDLYIDIEDLEESIAIEKDNAKIYKLQYDEGIISKTEYNNLKDKVVLLKNELRRAELDINMKYAELLAFSNPKKVIKK